MSYYLTKGQAVVALRVLHDEIPVGRKGKVVGLRAGDTGPEYLVKFERKAWPVACVTGDLA